MIIDLRMHFNYAVKSILFYCTGCVLLGHISPGTVTEKEILKFQRLLYKVQVKLIQVQVICRE